MIVGLDEVGRGCWAGPIVAGAVILDQPIQGVTDSKLLTKKRREELAAKIHAQAIAVGLGWVSVEEIDALRLTEAVRLAMQRALGCIGNAYEEIIIDGNYNFFPDDSRSRAIVRADFTVPTVSAASIVAKVARDSWMATEAVRLYPGYQFEKHVGYGTALHRQLLAEHGVCALHRRSFKPVQALAEQGV